MQFNPPDWTDKKPHGSKRANILAAHTNVQLTEIEKVKICIAGLKEKGIDLTQDYSDWIKFGFGFTSLDPQGRELFHELSKLHSKYDYDACDRKYDNLLSSSNGSVTLATFFNYCTDVGVMWKNRLPSTGNPTPQFSPTPVTTKEQDTNSDILNGVLAIRSELLERIKEEIKLIPPLLNHNDHGVIWKNTINVIMGHKGSHKSRLCEGLCALILNKTPKHSWAGFSHYELYPKDYYLIYVDTERPLADQYPKALQGIIKRTGCQEKPKNFDFISLIMEPRDQRFKMIQAYIERTRKEVKIPIIVVIDVVTDLTNNFNDPNESLVFIDWLNLMINKHEITFFCVIHENPGTGYQKARGHLGTELGNKASTEVKIGFELDKKKNPTDLIKLEFPKVRAGRPPESAYLKWSNHENGLVIASGEDVAFEKAKKKEKAPLNEVIDALPEIFNKPLNYTNFLKAIISKFDCGRSIAANRIKELLNIDPTIQDKSGQLYALRKKGKEKNMMHFLEKKPGSMQGQKSLFENGS